MSNGADNYKSGDRKDAISTVLDTIQGTPDLTSVYDQFSDLQQTEMKADLTSRIEKEKLEDRHQLHFDLALYRGLRYAAASSKHCLVLGMVNNVRELYEGQRMRYPDDEAPPADSSYR